jgi:acetylornithine deacetylase/succinyl-diaminopimelate desuccinylase-like protein
VILVIAPGTDDRAGTTLLYGHLDKQPPLGQWSDGLDPYQPVRRGNQVFARGVADDGYSIYAATLALEEMDRRGLARGRCVILIEASEESGSPDLSAYLDHLAPTLEDVRLLICLDSGATSYDRLWITTALRGMVSVELTVAVLERGQHSGLASGVAPSSFRIMRELLDRVEDSRTGEILIPELIAEIPAHDLAAAEALVSEFGDVAADELPFVSGVSPMGASPLERVLNQTWRPTLSITGVDGIPSVALAGNVLRASTTLVLSFRLPPTVDHAIAEAAITRRLTENPPYGARITCTVSGANGWVSPTPSAALRTALESGSIAAFGNTPAYRSEGGSIPFLAELGQRYPGVEFVATGVLGPNSNAHGIDEMLDLDCMTGVINAVISVVNAAA